MENLSEINQAVRRYTLRHHWSAASIALEPVRGIAIQLKLPAAEGEVAEEAPGVRERLREHGKRVLYVDDEESLVLLITRILKPHGYQVTGYTDPEQALQAFRERPHDFDVVVTDLSMPGMLGTDLARALIKIRPDVPIVLTTGYIRPETVEAARRVGISEVVLKSDTVEEMGRALQAVFQRRNTVPRRRHRPAFD